MSENRVHYAHPASDYTACGRYVYNRSPFPRLQITADPAITDCKACLKRMPS